MSLWVFTPEAELTPPSKKVSYGMGQWLRLCDLKHSTHNEISMPSRLLSGKVLNGSSHPKKIEA